MAAIGNPIRPDHVFAMTGEQFRYVVRDIGDWNMEVVNNINVAHGLAFKTIRAIFGWIRNDADTLRYPINYVKDHYYVDGVGAPARAVSGSSPTIREINSVNIFLHSEPQGFFDDPDYNAVPYNRGQLLIMYED